jgi:hypothetical protein
VPLSEREQRILEEIERNLYKEDRGFARGVKREAPRMRDRRRVRLGVLTFAVGFLVLIAFFVTGSVLVGVAAFGAMVYGIVMIAGSLIASMAPRRPPGPSLEERARSFLKSFEDKLKDRYKRDR